MATGNKTFIERASYVATLVPSDVCRKLAFKYFLAAAESDDEKMQEILLQHGRRWIRLAA